MVCLVGEALSGEDPGPDTVWGHRRRDSRAALGSTGNRGPPSAVELSGAGMGESVFTSLSRNDVVCHTVVLF